jgi:hypothetical protein
MNNSISLFIITGITLKYLYFYTTKKNIWDKYKFSYNNLFYVNKGSLMLIRTYGVNMPLFYIYPNIL